MHLSIATLSNPEFINLKETDISPLISSCDIKVLYLGENRNQTFITKEVATEMAATLRGCPIVGYYSEEHEDFRDHGDLITIDGDGIKFSCQTKPYGFVAPDAKVWFQDFEDDNSVIRTYLMTTGYLWTGQFPEVQKVTTEGRPQSMELDEETLQGQWEIDQYTGLEFFIINDAMFSKLCILGNDVEPCFEGASVTGSTQFSLDNNFTQTLYSMMQDLNKLVTSQKGGEDMDNTTPSAMEAVEFKAAEEQTPEVVEEETPKVPEEEKEETLEVPEEQTEAECEEPEKPEEDEEPTDEKYTQLEQECATLAATVETLNSELTELRAFKLNIENAQKDAMIEKFYMLSDEDKADVIANKASYTCEEIEEKLSVICFRKKVSFASKEAEKPEVTYNLTDASAALPDWVKAVKNNQGGNN